MISIIQTTQQQNYYKRNANIKKINMIQLIPIYYPQINTKQMIQSNKNQNIRALGLPLHFKGQ